MKYLKVLGLAAVMAVAMMAVFGSASASAEQTVQICKQVPSPDGDGKCLTGLTEREYDGAIPLTSENPVLTTNVAIVTCEHSATTTDPEASTGTNSITGSITALSFTGNCKTNGGTACTVTVVNLPYEAHLYTNNLLVTDVTGAGATVKCGFLINCTFTTKEAELSISHSGNNTIAKAEGVQLLRSGGFCPETSTWSAEYVASGYTVT